MPQKGAISGRLFEPSKAGGKILELSYREVKIADRGVNLVEFHVRRFNPVGQAELKMVERLRKIAQGTLKPEMVDLRFYTHELREHPILDFGFWILDWGIVCVSQFQEKSSQL